VKINNYGWAPVAHTCNPSYSGGRDQEDHSSKPAWKNTSQDPILKIPITKRAGGVAQGEGHEFKPHYSKKKKKLCIVSQNAVTMTVEHFHNEQLMLGNGCV
jgi:hypothetical protein